MAKERKYGQMDELTFNAAMNLATGGARQAAPATLEDALDVVEEEPGTGGGSLGGGAGSIPGIGGAAGGAGSGGLGTGIGGAAGGGRPTYTGSFEEQLADILGQIQGREKFSYDVNADPLYDMYKDRYIEQGKLAMKDTMGQAAALTGGYGSTYGQQVGQQTYDAYLQNLAAVIPELYGMAYDRYQDEGDELLKLYGLVGDQRDTEYGRYRDELSDWNYDQEVARELERQDYERRTAEEQEAYNRRISEEKERYSRQQQAMSTLVAIIKASGYNPTDEELQEAGLTREAVDAIRKEYERQVNIENQEHQLKVMSAYSSGGGGGGSSYGGGGGGSGYSASVAAIQQQLNALGAGLAVDGIWGPLTEAAYNRYFGGGGSYKYGTEAADYAATAAQRAAQAGQSYTQYLKEKTAEGKITPKQASDIRKDLKRLAP